ncbi:transposase family protein [Streptomyces sp. NPDC057027]|uniref:transposase family protein n=1 Tax=Streptomyces sp. NPDC057027 TaxID=3346004 RepID=UPI0036315531
MTQAPRRAHHLVRSGGRHRRRARNTRWRKLGRFQQALLTPVHLRKNETFSQLGAGLGTSQSTAWRYADENLDVLASRSPGLHKALTGLGEGDHVIVDDTLIPIDRIRANEPYCSMKHPRHGMNVQVITHPDGTPLWFSRAAPGRTHDLTAARPTAVVQTCPPRQILAFANRADQGAGATFRTPYHHHCEQPEHQKQSNRDHARLRTPGERAFAQLKPWRLLRRTRCSTHRTSTIVQAAHTLLTCSHSG